MFEEIINGLGTQLCRDIRYHGRSFHFCAKASGVDFQMLIYDSLHLQYVQISAYLGKHTKSYTGGLFMYESILNSETLKYG